MDREVVLHTTALERATAAIRAARDAIASHGPVRRVDGRLMAGDLALADAEGLVDAVRDTLGHGCTIFDRNVRIATTARAAGSDARATGTTANAMISHRVHRLGQRFAGITHTIGKDWVIAYEPLRDESDAIVGMLAAFQELECHLDDLRALDDTDHGVLLLDADGHVLDANRVARDMLGRADLVGERPVLGLGDLSIPADGAALTREVVWTQPDGHRYPVEVTLRRIGDRQLVLARDFTAAAEARAALEEVNAQLEQRVAARTDALRRTLTERAAMLDHLTDGLAAITPDGSIAVLNPAMRSLLGRVDAGRETIGLHDLHADLPSAVARCQDTGEVVSLDLSLPGGRVGGAVVSPIRAGGRPYGAVVLVRDITLAKEVDRMKTDFIATVSHELRTPLTSMMGFARLAHRKVVDRIAPALPDERRVQRAVRQVDANLGIIVQEGKRLARLIDDVLDISKMEAGEVDWSEEVIDVLELVDASLTVTAGMFAEGPVALRSQVEPGLAPIVGDRDRLLQVLLNLIGNARKFTSRGHVLVSAESDGDGVRLAVSDTGCGIAARDHEAVFGRFKQASDTLTDKPRGTGLGLPICRHIVERHGGTLGLTSRPGHGSTFWFVLPDRDAEPTSPRERRIRRPPSGTRRADIVVVDDDAALRELLDTLLTEAGHHVRTAASGLEGVQQVRERRPDLLLLDVRMPDISGFDVAAVLRADPVTRDLPILVLSSAPDRRRADAAQVDRALAKPIDPDELIRSIDALLAGEAAR
jgi:hypothetical protein